MSHPLLNQINAKLDELLLAIQELKSGSKTFMNVQEAAAFLGVSKSTLYKYTSSGEIAYSKPNGKIILFNRADLENWIGKMHIPSNSNLNNQH
jgi:excisionase family DNA binding protein